MIFIDSTKEINTNLERFIQLNFSISEIKENPPLPLEFIINEIHEDSYYNFEEKNSNNKYYDADYLLYFCELNENECEYIGAKSFHFKEGKSYKIKMNWCFQDNSFYFDKMNIIHYFIKEIEFGTTFYETSGEYRTNYFIINAKNFKSLFIDIENCRLAYYKSCKEEEVKLFPYNIEKLKYNTMKKEVFYPVSVNDDDNYIVLQIFDKVEIYNTFIHIVNYKNLIGNSDYSFSLEYQKGTYGIITFSEQYYSLSLVILSSDNNMGLYRKNFPSGNLTNIIYTSQMTYDDYLYINSTKDITIIKANPCQTSYYFHIIVDYTFNQFFNKYGPDSMFMKTSSHSFDYTFNSTYLFDIKDNYYLYIKKYYGDTNIFQYNKPIDTLTNITLFQEKLRNYENPLGYKLINNQLIKISGFQFFTFHMKFNSLFDFYIQKVDDLESVEINSEMFKFGNLVKIFTPNKKYSLNFTLDHLIKLDNNFLEAEVKFIKESGEEYILNKENKIIEDLKGDNIKVKANKEALVYFYKRIPNYSENNTIIFDNNQKRKNMKFTLTNTNDNENVKIYLAKDFGFIGYYPMININNWDEIDSKNNIATIYVDNYYDKIEWDLYDGEKYIIYIFNSNYENNMTNYKISNLEYLNNLLTPKNKYNFELIKANSEGTIIIDTKNKPSITYQIFQCESRQIKFKIENSNGYFKGKNDYLYMTINVDSDSFIDMNLNNNEILSHSFESDKEFLFAYFPENKDEIYEKEYSAKPSIYSLGEISQNIFQLEFVPTFYFTY